MAILRRGSHTHAELLHADALRRWLASRPPQAAVLQRYTPPKDNVRWVVTYAAQGGVAEVVAVPRRFGDAYPGALLVADPQPSVHADQAEQGHDGGHDHVQVACTTCHDALLDNKEHRR